MLDLNEAGRCSISCMPDQLATAVFFAVHESVWHFSDLHSVRLESAMRTIATNDLHRP
jgi:hypothetical protein